VTAGVPLPPTDEPLAAPFWEWAAKGELRLPRDADGQFQWYPTDPNAEWVRLSGRATLFSWATVAVPLDPRYAGIVPYISATVVPVEAPNLRLVTRLVDVAAAELRAGMPLELRILDLGTPGPPTGVPAPFFGPAG
jgi:uncharacterized OB-fold protein